MSVPDERSAGRNADNPFTTNPTTTLPSPTPNRANSLTQSFPDHNDNDDISLLTLPNELLLQILRHLAPDQPSLECLRRTCRVFLRTLPDIFPKLFSKSLQGSFPWPVRRMWTFGVEQRRALAELLARDSELSPGRGRLQAVGRRQANLGSVEAEGGVGGSGNGGKRVIGVGGKFRCRRVLCERCGMEHPKALVERGSNTGAVMLGSG
ncbi:hypothetical protein VTI74DRAFT_7509 [Chaetomium olivicolor]